MRKWLVTLGGAECIVSYRSVTEPGTCTKSCQQHLYRSLHIYLLTSIACLVHLRCWLEARVDYFWATHPREAEPDSKYSCQGQFSFFLDFLCFQLKGDNSDVSPKGKANNCGCSKIFKSLKERSYWRGLFLDDGVVWQREKGKKRNGTDPIQELFTVFLKKKKKKVKNSHKTFLEFLSLVFTFLLYFNWQ